MQASFSSDIPIGLNTGEMAIPACARIEACESSLPKDNLPFSIPMVFSMDRTKTALTTITPARLIKPLRRSHALLKTAPVLGIW